MAVKTHGTRTAPRTILTLVSEEHRVNVDMDEDGEVHACDYGQIALYTARAPGKESGNEDCVAFFCFDDDRGVLLVTDGMGGMPRGDEAAALAVTAMRESLLHAPRSDSGLRESILNGIDNANKRIGELGVGAGSTLAAVEINGDVIRPYHVGDSMILVVGRRGKIKLYTVSHSPVGYAVEAGFLDAAEAMSHEHRHIVSNMLGTSDMRVEMGPPLALARYDTVLLASDGLFDNFHVEEIAERIRKGPLDVILPDLVHETRHRMRHPEPQRPCKPDDLGLIIYRRG